MKRTVFLMVLMLVVMASVGLAQDIKFSGLSQTWFSYTQPATGDENPYGFTIRTLRLKAGGSFTKNITWSFQVAWDKQVASMLDVQIDFLLAKGFNLRVGQFAAPGAASGALTSSAKLDMVERPTITEYWGKNADLAGYRALGVQAYGDIVKDKFSYAFMLANPKTVGIFTPGVSSSSYRHTNNGIMFWGRLEGKPAKGVTVGAFLGTGKEKDTNMKRSSYGANLFYVKDAINLKFEYIGGEYGATSAKTEYNGFYGVFGYTIKKKFEPIVSYCVYTPNQEADADYVKHYNDLILGLNYFLNKNVKIQVNYVLRDETMISGKEKIKNNIFYTCFQYTF